jgi:hypothetical protein
MMTEDSGLGEAKPGVAPLYLAYDEAKVLLGALMVLATQEDVAVPPQAADIARIVWRETLSVKPGLNPHLGPLATALAEFIANF